MGDYYEDKYNSLLRKYERLQDQYNELRVENKQLYNQLENANFRIRTELEPRIKSEKQSYDCYVTDPERKLGGKK